MILYRILLDEFARHQVFCPWIHWNFSILSDEMLKRKAFYPWILRTSRLSNCKQLSGRESLELDGDGFSSVCYHDLSVDGIYPAM